MKYFLLLVSLITSIAASAQSGFKTIIDLKGLPDSVEITARVQDEKQDKWQYIKLKLVKGKATIEGQSRMTDPATMYIYTPKGTISTFVQNGVTEKISGKADDIKSLSYKQKGAPWSKDFMTLNALTGEIEADLQDAFSRYNSLTKEEKEQAIALQDRRESLKMDYYHSHPNSWITLSHMQYQMQDMPREEVSAIYDALKPPYKESSYATTIFRFITTQQIKPGDNIADFDIVATDQNGKKVKLSDYKGKYLVVDFSQRFCGACVMANRDIPQIAEKYADKVLFINYSCDDSEKDWKESIKRDNITWPSIWNGSGITGQDCLRYCVNSFPHFFIFNPEGILISEWSGYGPGLFESRFKELGITE